MVKTLVDGLNEINNTWADFQFAKEKTKLTLQKNLFPPKLNDKVVKYYLSNQYNGKNFQ